MAHLVRHRTPAGDTVSTEVADLDEAVVLVERLHNEEQAEDVRVFAEVPLRVQTYVRVSVAERTAREGATPPAPEPADDEPAPAPVEASADDVPVTEEVPAAPVPPPPGVLAPVRVEAPSADAEALVDATQADGRRSLFHRS